MYFKSELNTDPAVSGPTYPQAECLTLGDAHSIKVDEFANPDTIELEYKLASKAKLTDILSQAAISANGLLVNQKVKDILEGFNLMQHRYYPVTVHIKKPTAQYYWLHLVDNSLITFVDFPNSQFYRTKFSYKEDDITLETYQDYLKKLDEFGFMCSIESDSIKLNNNFDRSLDLYMIAPFDSRPYFSEKLWNAFESEGITGIRLAKSIS